VRSADHIRCDVSDALCKLKYPNGGFLSGLTMWSPQRQDGPTKIIGPAYTVKYVPLDDPTPKLSTHYVSGVSWNTKGTAGTTCAES
jgi:regulator of RNase E activity RraA